MRNSLRIVLAVVLLAAACFAENLTGAVTNGTTNKPSAGDDVILIKLGQGMEEAGRVKSDAQGKFTLPVNEAGPHLVRVVHQGVTYHRMAPPGTKTADVQVFDVSKKLAAISVTADVLRFQAQGNELQGVRLFAVDNTSRPPRTQMNDQNFEFYLPDGVQVDSSFAQTEGGQAVNSAPVPQAERNRYAFVFPLRPGETQFQITFHVPYNGKLQFDPKSIYAAQHFVVMLPKTMQFASDSTAFKAMKDPRQSDAVVQVATQTTAGQSLAFKISGTGLMPEQKEEQNDAQASAEPTPGGGLGPADRSPRSAGKISLVHPGRIWPGADRGRNLHCEASAYGNRTTVRSRRCRSRRSAAQTAHQPKVASPRSPERRIIPTGDGPQARASSRRKNTKKPKPPSTKRWSEP